ncbi:family 16 glycosylhydrolase [Flavobacteriales bacterium]|nr:family 16 glycosylhydrolase [Flavobacteriales bacterium]MDG1348407.1 family 16 glycosylhydrolase [Flavobacteriales bacterium]
MKVRIIFFLISLFVFSLNAQNWQLVWEDDFNGSSLNQSKWVHDIGTGSQYGMWGWGNGELQYYQPQNTTLNNGIAKIEVKEEPNGIIDSWSATSYFSSSKITTKGLFNFRYGKVEARIKTIDGQGFWPAFWMLPSNGSWPCDGEIDIMEQWGNDYLTNSTSGAAHLGACPYSQSTHYYETSSSYISSGSYADDFHTYSVIWKEDTITWYVDEIELFSLNPSSYWSIPSQSAWPFNANEWYLMINLAITQAGPNSNTVFPNQMEIDYVRVYQENLTKSINIDDKNKYIVFPNPANYVLTIQGKNISSIKIFNIHGNIVLSKNVNNNKKVDISILNKGMYLVELEDYFGFKINKKVIIN